MQTGGEELEGKGRLRIDQNERNNLPWNDQSRDTPAALWALGMPSPWPNSLGRELETPSKLQRQGAAAEHRRMSHAAAIGGSSSPLEWARVDPFVSPRRAGGTRPQRLLAWREDPRRVVACMTLSRSDDGGLGDATTTMDTIRRRR